MGLSFEGEPFEFTIKDPSITLFDQLILTNVINQASTLNFTDKLIEIALWFPADQIFGLGERNTPSFELCEGSYRKCIYTSFNRDIAVHVDHGKFPGGNNSYGHHPFYLLRMKDKQFAAVLLLNSNAQDTIIERKEEGIEVRHKTIGGILDFYFFYPGSVDEVIKRYHSFIGRPYLPPLWALGFHQCRWGWKNLNEVKDVVKMFEYKDIPLDVVWSDIDYMQDFRDFTVDKKNYEGLGLFVDELHKKGMHWVPIIDAGLKFDSEDKYFKEGETTNAFIKSAKTKKTLIGMVWPGYAVYPAWMSNNASELWRMGLGDLYKQAKFDGIWIDMNEASNFCHGECEIVPNEVVETIITDDGKPDVHDPKEFDKLPYLPGNRSLLTKAVSPTGYHVVSKDPYGDKFYKEYNLHSLWAFHQANSTARFFTEVQKRRPFVVTRASFAGTGRFASKWLGDNHSTWADMRHSIAGMYNFQLFGIPLVGSDICGFYNNTDEEMCARWMQLGAFYPFSRNHNANKSKSQEPYRWDNVALAGRNAIRQKYSIIRYYYTKLFEVSLNGGMLIKPLFFEYPKDENAYAFRNKNFMIGSALLVVPVLEEKVHEVVAYLPNENWFNLFTGRAVLRHDPQATQGQNVSMFAGYSYVNVLIRGGSIVPYQEATNGRVRRVATLDYLQLEVVVAPGGNGEASGNFIFDDQSAIDPIATEDFAEVTWKFSMEKKELAVFAKNAYKGDQEFEKFYRLTILGAGPMAGVKYACVGDKNSGKVTAVPGNYYPATRTLSFYKHTNIHWADVSIVEFRNSCE
eukprot:TRINITY_DN5053_c0_g1_i18.p1 TRINITY_DN5053_c0_g1~~TRINITY_DN5053_c0_g1_i18.p1  ORF type:complete len:797 (+),score=236.90 TRINITY_DN5053_c0_g1_i18:92-2482(+)